MKKRKDIKVFFEDESEISMNPPLRGDWSKKGKQKKVSERGLRLCIFGAKGADSKLRFFMISSQKKGKNIIDFFKLKGVKGKICIIFR